VVATDGRGGWVSCRFEAGSTTSPPGAALRADGDRGFEPPPSIPVTVGFSLVKGDRPEWIVQKLTELGVDRIVVVHADRSVVHWSADRRPRVLDRLRVTAAEACAQSRRLWLPEVLEAPSVSAAGPLVASAGGGGPIGLAEFGGAPPSLERPTVLTGPEGGWSKAELDLGFPTVGLGPTVLRAETAAVAVGVLLTGLRAGTVT
jgi:16S rRNA (uracil1498-N3)-methyltransferase